MRMAHDLIASRDDFEAALAEADAMPRFDGAAAWAAVCGAFDKLDAIHGFSGRLQVAYGELARLRDPSRLLARAEEDMRLGGACAAFAAFRQGLPRGWPLAAWAFPRKAFVA